MMPKYIVEGDVTVRISGYFEVEIEAKSLEAAEEKLRDLWDKKNYKELGKVFPSGRIQFDEGEMWQTPEAWQDLQVYGSREMEEE